MAKANQPEAASIYREVELRDGRRVSVRLMEPRDGPRILEFVRSLPPDDLLFLRTDITEPATSTHGRIILSKARL